MDKLLNLEDITLYPTSVNNSSARNKLNYCVKDEIDGTISLPIFTSPSSAIISKNNWNVFNKNGIRPILPRTEDINVRLEGCKFIFAAFSNEEIIEHFINKQQQSGVNYHICIENWNGHDKINLDIAAKLKYIYGKSIIIMSGVISNAKAYLDYCNIGVDYIRVGGSCSLLDPNKYGFYYPLASLLIDVLSVKNISCGGNVKFPKIIADGGIMSSLDIIKCMALGADYVMCGKLFVKTIEAAGKIYNKVRKPEVGDVLDDITENVLQTLEKPDLRDLDLRRFYYGNTSYETQSMLAGFGSVSDWLSSGKANPVPVDVKAEKVKVTGRLSDFLKEFYDCASYGFIMADADDWKQFKEKIKYGRID